MDDLNLVWAKLKYEVKRGSVDMIDSVLKMTIDDPKERDLTLIAISMEYLRHESEDGKATRPFRYLVKYLQGTGKPEHVDLFALQAADVGVRRSIHRQVLTYIGQQQMFDSSRLDFSSSGRLANIADTRQDYYNSHYRMMMDGRTSRALKISVPQENYAVKDWCNAIGGFTLDFRLIKLRSGGTASQVYLSGTNTYRWHPDIPRVSQRVHEAAERMKKFGAKEFDIVFRPCAMTTTGLWRHNL